jgi:hypothetical protein
MIGHLQLVEKDRGTWIPLSEASCWFKSSDNTASRFSLIIVSHQPFSNMNWLILFGSMNFFLKQGKSFVYFID